MNQSLKSKAVSGLFWNSLEKIGQQGVQFVVGIILARLLLVEHFGLIGMLTVFMAIAQSFIDSGFGSALIQKRSVTYIDECSIFYFNIFLGFLGAGILYTSAPWIAGFYNQPLLIVLTRVLSFNLIINAFGLVQSSLLTKELNFKTQLKVGLLSSIISGAIGVSMAFFGFGIWSLVMLSISGSFFRTALLWFFNTWRPSITFSFDSLRSMFVFGSRLLASGLLNTVFENIYIVVIGRLFSPIALGFYARAKGLQQLPAATLSEIVCHVTFPAFSLIQNDKIQLKRCVRMALNMLVMINFPLMIGLAVVARPLVLVLLTEKWLPCVLYMQLFCVVSMLYPLHVINLNVLTAQGRSDLFLRLEILKKILVVIAIVATYQWGVDALIVGQVFTSFLGYFLNAYYSGKMLDYPIAEQIKDLIPCLAISGVMGLGVYAVNYTSIINQVTLLAAQIIVGIVLYSGMCFFFRISSFFEILEIIKLRLIKV